MDDLQEAEALEAELDALGDSPTTAQILDVLKKGYRDAGVAAALKRTGGGGGGGSSAVVSETVVLTDAQIKALPVTAVSLVAAPGADKLLRFVAGYLSKDFTAGGYSNNGATAIYFVYDTENAFRNASITMRDAKSDPFLTGATIRHATFPANVDFDDGVASASFPNVMVTVPSSNLINTDIGIYIDNELGAFTGGNAANTLTVTVLYTVIDIP